MGGINYFACLNRQVGGVDGIGDIVEQVPVPKRLLLVDTEGVFYGEFGTFDAVAEFLSGDRTCDSEKVLARFKRADQFKLFEVVSEYRLVPTVSFREMDEDKQNGQTS